jgi:hypothetical protein
MGGQVNEEPSLRQKHGAEYALRKKALIGLIAPLDANDAFTYWRS